MYVYLALVQSALEQYVAMLALEGVNLLLPYSSKKVVGYPEYVKCHCICQFKP